MIEGAQPVLKRSESLPRSEFKLLTVIIACGLLVRLALFIGYQGFDDRTYIAYAWYVAQGGDIVSAGLMDHWMGRAAAWGPMALAIRIFGTGEWVFSLYSLIASLASFVVLFLLGRLLVGARTALYATALLVLLPIDVFYATRAFADEALGFWNIAAFTAFVFALERGERWLGVLAGFLTGIGYATKETSLLLVVPFALILLQYRVFPIRLLALLGAGFLTVFLMELGFWQAATGDSLYRFHVVSAAREFGPAPKAMSTVWDWIPGPLPGEAVRSENSIVEAVLVFFTNEEWGLLFCFVFPVAAAALFGRKSGCKTLAIFLISTTALLLFFPLYFPHFTLQRDPRYFTMLSVPALLLFADWALGLGRGLRILAFFVVVLAWIPCLYVGWASSRIDAQRGLAAFLRDEASEIIWMSNLDASNALVLSDFDPSLKIGILAPPGVRESGDLSKAQSSVTRAIVPSAPVTRSPYELRGQLVVFSDDSPPGEGWTLIRTFSAHPRGAVLLVQRVLTTIGVPSQYVDKVAPSQGKTIRLFRTQPAGDFHTRGESIIPLDSAWT